MPPDAASSCPSGWIASSVQGSSSCYAFSARQVAQANCQVECASLHERANLVCIEDADEQDFIAERFSSSPMCCGYEDVSCCTWIGLYREPTDQGTRVGWTNWRGQCRSSFTSWVPGEPNDYGGSEDCAFYGWDGHSRWLDAPCDAPFSCLCELDLPSPPSPPSPPFPPPAPPEPPAPPFTCPPGFFQSNAAGRPGVACADMPASCRRRCCPYAHCLHAPDDECDDAPKWCVEECESWVLCCNAAASRGGAAPPLRLPPAPPSCYVLTVEADSHAGCAELCASRYNATLPCIGTEEESRFVGQMLGGQPTWIGAYQSSSDRGVDAGWPQWAMEGCDSTFVNWAPGEPNDGDDTSGLQGGPLLERSREDCAMIGVNGDGARWYDAGCGWKGARCACEWPGRAGKGYAVFAGTQSQLGRVNGVGDSDFELKVAMWIAAVLGAFIGIGVAVTHCVVCGCCLRNDGCAVRETAKRGLAADASYVRSCCCWRADHTAARRTHSGVRVRTEAFDAVRGFGALQVAVGHFFSFWARGDGDGLELGGGNAVLMFFVMSGFVMTVGYAGKGPADGGCCGASCCRGFGGGFAIDFWARRVARIGPLYWLSVLLYLPLAWQEMRYLPDDGARTFAIFGSLVSTLLFAQTWLASVGIYFAGAINGPLWSIGAQFHFYWLFPSLVDRMHTARSRCRLIAEGGTWWLLYVLLWILSALLYSGFATDFLVAGYLAAHVVPWNKLPLFLLGMIAGSDALLRTAAASSGGGGGGGGVGRGGGLGGVGGSWLAGVGGGWRVVADAITLCLACYTTVQGGGSPGHGGFGFATRLQGELLFAPLYALWLLALTQAPLSWSARVLCWRPFRKLGEWSYALYVLHFPLLHYYAWARFGGEYWVARPSLHGAEVFPVFSLLLGASALAYELVEKRCRAPLARWLVRWCKVPPQAAGAGGGAAGSATPTVVMATVETEGVGLAAGDAAAQAYAQHTMATEVTVLPVAQPVVVSATAQVVSAVPM